MTLREIQLCISVSRDRQLDRLDELTYQAWHAAAWSSHVKKLPKFEDVLPKRQKRRRKLTLEEDIARFATFFRRVGRGKAKVN